jgi:hypothetical protein
MKDDPILEEVWQIKDDLAREAGYDARRFFENPRPWSKSHSHTGLVVHSAEERQRLAAEYTQQRAESSVPILKSEF